jgi:N-acetylglucosamine-6-phosphate deacetylase
MNNSTALTNGILYTGDAVLHGRAVMIENGVITGLPNARFVPEGMETVDLSGRIVSPGFIDVQVNGGGGAFFTADPTPEALRTIAAAHLRHGTLFWCPAVISSDMETTERCLGAVRKVMGENIGVIGAHLEGPYLSHEKPGIHDTRFIRSACDTEIESLLKMGAGAVSLITVAPEAVGERHIQAFTDAGIRVFLGHTNAPRVIADAAFAAGVCGVTHLYNAMSQMSGREPGVTGAAFAAKDVWASIIADGFHVDWLSVKIAKDTKKSRLFLITDAMPPVGSADGSFAVGSETVTCTDGRCETADGTLAGSALDMAAAVRNCVNHCGIAPDEALRMATLYPAAMLGRADTMGCIKPGASADLVFLNETLHVEGVMRGGAVTFFNG